MLELRVANLGTWGAWVPAGWRLGGELHASASIGGRFGAPEYTGHVEGSGIGVRNFLQGVNVNDGSVAIALQGSTRAHRALHRQGRRRHRLRSKATPASARAPAAHLDAQRRQVRDARPRRPPHRRQRQRGAAARREDARRSTASFNIDEGLVDFTRSDAPTLGDDVEVVRRPAAAAPPRRRGAAAAAAARRRRRAPAARQVALDLRVAMGEKLRVRGRGLDAGLRGELHLTSPGGRLAVDGTLRAVDGTYQAYGQKLGIDRGVLTFAGAGREPAPRHRGDAARTSTCASACRSPARRSTRASACSPSPT